MTTATKQKLNHIRDMIQDARLTQVQLDILTKKLFDTLCEYKVDLDVKSDAENAETLNEAILCYIEYREYSLNKIIEEISNAMEVN